MGKVGQAILGTPLGRYGTLLVLGGILFAIFSQAFSDKTTWAYFSLAVIALVPMALFLANRRVDHLFGLIVIALLMGGVYLLDRFQETSPEQVLRKTNELLRAVERADYAVFERHLASDFHWQNMDKAGVLRRARQSLRADETRSCGISAARVRGDDGSLTLVVEGNLSANGQFGSENGTFLGLIELTYKRQPNGQYQLTGVKVTWPNGMEVGLPK